MNKERQDDKDGLVMLLPHIFQAIKGKPNRLRQHVEEIEDNIVKDKLRKIIVAYKIRIWFSCVFSFLVY